MPDLLIPDLLIDASPKATAQIQPAPGVEH